MASQFDLPFFLHPLFKYVKSFNDSKETNSKMSIE